MGYSIFTLTNKLHDPRKQMHAAYLIGALAFSFARFICYSKQLTGTVSHASPRRVPAGLPCAHTWIRNRVKLRHMFTNCRIFQ